MRCLWTQSAQDINGFPPNFHPPDSSSRGIHKDSMGFKWFHQQSIGVICGKPKIFIEVGDELWHWFHMFYHVIGVERKTHFKDTLLSHYASNETQLQRWTWKNSKVKAHRSWREKTGHAVSLKLWTAKIPWASHGHHPPGFVQKCGTDSKYSSQLLLVRWCWSFFSIWFAVWTTYLPAVHGLRHATGWSAWFIVRINSQHGQSEIPCNTKCLKHF